MKLGLLISGEYAVAEAVRLAVLAEAEGYDHAWFADERFYHEPYGPLALMARETRRIRLGPCVTDPYTRHPALTALAAATLDEISDGRAVCGLGAGKSGLPELGMERKQAALALKEATLLIRQLLTGQVVSFEGETTWFHDGRLNLPARPDLPIYIASTGTSPLTAAVAGEVADGVILAFCGTPISLAPALRRVEAGLARSGRLRSDLEVVVRLDSAVAADGSAARDALRPVITRMLYRQRENLTAYLAPYGVAVPEAWAERLRTTVYRGHSREPGALDGLARELPDEALAPFTLAGTPDEVAAQVRSLQQLGVDHVIVQPKTPAGSSVDEVVRLCARSIRPQAERA